MSEQSTDPKLLREYAKGRSESVSAELLRRHVNFAYSAALRMVRDTHLAEDATPRQESAVRQRTRWTMSRSQLASRFAFHTGAE